MNNNNSSISLTGLLHERQQELDELQSLYRHEIDELSLRARFATCSLHEAAIFSTDKDGVREKLLARIAKNTAEIDLLLHFIYKGER